ISPGGEPDRPGDGEPGVAGEEAGGGEAGQARPADGPARDVVDGEPDGEGDHAEPREPPPGVRPGGGDGGARADEGRRDEEAVGCAAAEERDAGEFEALPGDREDQERGEPRDDLGHGPAAEPQQRAGVPGDRAGELDGEVPPGAAAEDRDVDRDEPAAGGGEEELAGQGQADGRGEAAGAREGGGGVGPGAPEGDGAFEGDEGAE